MTPANYIVTGVNVLTMDAENTTYTNVQIAVENGTIVCIAESCTPPPNAGTFIDELLL
jgi:hypothetical protein